MREKNSEERINKSRYKKQEYFEEVLKNIEKRDFIDSTREDSPLRQAPDAVVLDNSDMTIDEQNAFLLRLFEEKVGC